MAQVKNLLMLKDELNQFVSDFNAYVDSINQLDEDHEQLTLDSYAIPDENPNPQPVSFEAIQVHLAKKAQAGFSKDIKKLIQSYGVEKLSDIDPSDYLTLWKQVDDIG